MIIMLGLVLTFGGSKSPWSLIKSKRQNAGNKSGGFDESLKAMQESALIKSLDGSWTGLGNSYVIYYY